jgi:hypothetical protein
MIGLHSRSYFGKKSPRSRHITRRSPALEQLESRELLAVQLQLDYSLDTDGFMTASRRALLQSTLQAITNRLENTLAPVSSENFSFPKGNGTVSGTTSVPANTVKVYVYGGSLPGNQAGLGGGQYTGPTVYRGQAANHYAPDVGFIEFDDDGSTNWYFGASTTGGVDLHGNSTALNRNNFDFVSTADHELLHVLGFSTNPVFNSFVNGSGYFQGSLAEQANLGTPVPLDGPNGPHISSSLPSVINPSTDQGVRMYMSNVEWGMLQDLGWSVASPPGFDREWDLFTQGSGGTVDVEIVPGRGVYLMQVDALAGDTLTLNTRDGVFPYEMGAFTYLKLYDAQGNLITSAGIPNNSPPKAFLSWHFTHGGVYYVGVSSLSQNDYTFTTPSANQPDSPIFFLDANLSGPADTEPTNIATATSPVNIGAGGYSDTTTLLNFDTHVYAINTVPGHSYLVQTSLPAGGGFAGAAIISIYDGSGHKIAGMVAPPSESDIGGHYGAVTFTAPSAGPYYVFVQPYQGDAQVSPDARSVSVGWSFISSSGEFSGGDSGGGRNKGSDYTLTISDSTAVAAMTPPTFLREVRIVVLTGKRHNKKQTFYALLFSAALNRSEVQNAGLYHVTQLKRQGKKLKQVNVGVTSVLYNAANDSVLLGLGAFSKAKPLNFTATGLQGANGTTVATVVTNL